LVPFFTTPTSALVVAASARRFVPVASPSVAGAESAIVTCAPQIGAFLHDVKVEETHPSTLTLRVLPEVLETLKRLFFLMLAITAPSAPRKWV